ncbi:MAG: SRPBCC family protein [Bacteroidota bacterium]
MEPVLITINAVIAAPRNLVWDRYTLPEHITKWNFASPDWHCPSASNDLREGGKYVAIMEAKDGSFGFDFEATYEEVIDNEKIIYRIADGRKVTCDFKDNGSSTSVTVTFEAETVHAPELQRDGWQSILNNFKAYAEGERFE